MKSVYEIVAVQDGIVFLIDLEASNSMSVTNDAERVYADVRNKYPNQRVVYRDTMGNWDEIVLENEMANFIPYNGPVPE